MNTTFTGYEAFRHLLKTGVETDKAPYTLHSGGTTNTFLNLSKPLRTSDGQKLVFDWLNHTFLYQAYYCNRIGGPLDGSDLVAIPAMQAFGAEACFGIKKDGNIDGEIKKDDDIILVDDVCTRGDSLIRAGSAVVKAGGKIRMVIVLVDRCEGKHKTSGANAVAQTFGCPYIVGYTLEELLADAG